MHEHGARRKAVKLSVAVLVEQVRIEVFTNSLRRSKDTAGPRRQASGGSGF